MASLSRLFGTVSKFSGAAKRRHQGGIGNAGLAAAWYLLLPVLLLATSAVPAWGQGQAVSASLNGIVSDSTGARVPGATVTVTNAEQGFSRSVVTDASGNYLFTLLPPSQYNFAVQAPGFKGYQQKGIVLEVGQAASNPVVLQVGSSNEEVVVTGQAPLLNTQDANLSAEVSGKHLVELPLNLRNPFGLVTLNSSVNNSSQTQALNGGGQQGTADQDISFFNFGGGFFGSTAFLFDGAWDTQNGWGGTMYVPSVDATQEFKIQTNSFTAQYGWSTGNVVNVVTKSGTNHFHGVAYEFLRNSALDANGYFANAAGLPKTEFHRHQFGGTIGGPLTIPGLYSGHDKTFFYAQYEGLRQSTPLSFVGTVPTTAFKSGDFGALLGASTGATDGLGRPILTGAIYDPRTTRAITAGQVDPSTGLTATATGYIRDSFPGNQIGSSIDPVAAKLATYYPTATSSALVNNFTSTASAPVGSNEYSIRIDHTLTQKTQIYGRWSWKHEFKNVDAAFYGDANPAGPGQRNPDNRYSFALGANHIFNSTTTLSTNLGIMRWVEGNDVQSAGFKPSSLGLPAYIDPNSPQFPVINTQGQVPLGPQNGAGEGVIPANVATISADFNKILGSHSITAGYMGILFGALGGRVAATNFNFDNSFTAGPDPNNPTSGTGNGFATQLLGFAASGSTGIVSNPATTKVYHGVYVQDDWKVNPKLTVNLGLRYEIQTAPTERHDKQAYFDYDATNPISGSVGGTYLGAVEFNGGANRRGLYNTPYTNFAPRLGVSYQVLPKLVLRGGYGIFFPTSFYGNAPEPGYAQTTPYTASLNGGLNPSSSLSSPFPTGLIPVSGSSLGELTDVGLGVTAVPSDRKSPYVEQWMAGFQYAFSPNDVFEASYVGNHGIRMVAGSVNSNQLNPSYLSQGNALLTQVTNPFYGTITNSGCGLDQPTVVKAQLLRPYPEFCDISTTQAPVGFSLYDALQTNYTHRFSKGVSILASYTFSKFIDNVEGVTDWAIAGNDSIRNYYNLAAERSVDADDIPHSLVVSYIYELPVGKGRALGSHLNRPVNAVIGGWQVSGISTFKQGFPLSITSSNGNANLYGGNQRPNLVGDPHIANPSIHQWFNTNAFAVAPAYTFGDVPRYFSTLRAPGYENWDFGLQKWFGFTEDVRLQIRGEMFNAFNHPNFYAPDQHVGDAGFGTITNANPSRDIQIAAKLYF
jgi:hypothetical protein